jgi:hypothetical protein
MSVICCILLHLRNKPGVLAFFLLEQLSASGWVQTPCLSTRVGYAAARHHTPLLKRFQLVDAALCLSCGRLLSSFCTTTHSTRIDESWTA